MKPFIMESPETAQPGCHYHGDLATDPSGRLYDRRVRERWAQSPVGPSAASTDTTPSERQLAVGETLSAVRAAARVMRQLMEQVAERHDLSEGRLFLLFDLWRAPEHQRPLGEVAEQLDVSPRNVTGLIDHLEKDGLVERVQDPIDRRSIRARLTQRGLSIVEQMWTEARTASLAAADDFSADELAELRHLCLRLVRNLTQAKAGSVPGTAA